jgi:hypothetical protein
LAFAALQNRSQLPSAELAVSASKLAAPLLHKAKGLYEGVSAACVRTERRASYVLEPDVKGGGGAPIESFKPQRELSPFHAQCVFDWVGT